MATAAAPGILLVTSVLAAVAIKPVQRGQVAGASGQARGEHLWEGCREEPDEGSKEEN